MASKNFYFRNLGYDHHMHADRWKKGCDYENEYKKSYLFQLGNKNIKTDLCKELKLVIKFSILI